MLIEFDKLTFLYPDTKKPIFTKLSVRLDRPGFHALFGPSGVGKTSFARLLIGAINGYEGRIRTEDVGTPLYSYNLERLPDWSSVGKHLEKITPESAVRRREKLVEIFGVQACLGSRFSRLSLGQQNRINLIRYLVQDFRLLIMDESLGNVDELTRERILLNIKAMFPEVIFLYISHNVVEVAKFCDRILVLRGAHKRPQTMIIPGQNHCLEGEPDSQGLQKTMLEIMNAS
ncbi:MAG: ATP-binding cassette domain-containing protein [Desulfosarcinaceae bacterium]|jgi:ABC-type multidrug transport system ATPase subunit